MELHYDVLQVPPGADEATIKKQWRRMSLLNHPDKGGSDQEMAKINRAWAVLGDKEKRAKYDKLGVDWDMDEDEENKVMEEVRLVMEPFYTYLLRCLFGSIYVFLIQYFWTTILLSIAGALFIGLSGEKDAWQGLGIVIAIAWGSRIGPWMFFFCESFILWYMLFVVGEMSAGFGVIGALISLFLGWWFAGRTFCYFISLVIGVVLSILLWGFLMASVFGRNAAAEQKLERFSSEIKPEIRKLKKEKRELQTRVKELKAQLRKLKDLS
mmetsp:Transcript_12621/g.31022  ORF Transcript_12621/g.31022 Transcript_12621/m.31022 type:complete len:268 (-) Transcript_12621:178-981(-)